MSVQPTDPWHAAPNSTPCGAGHHIFELGDFLIYPSEGMGPVAIAAGQDNARLIAAAPDLLAALQNMLGAFDNPVRRRKMPGEFEDESIASARAAIALATGTTP